MTPAIDGVVAAGTKIELIKRTLYVVGRGAAYRVALLAAGPANRAK